MRWLSRLVTVVVIVVVVAAVSALIRAKMPATKIGQGFRVWALFRDASRLAVGSPVVIAGVRIGDVERLTVEGDLARVDLKLKNPRDRYHPDGLEPLPYDSWITKKAESAFGDSYLEIIPTVAEPGAAPARMLQNGDRIEHVQEGGSTDTVLRSIAHAMPRIDRGLDGVHDFALTARKWANGSLEERIIEIERWLAAGNIDRPLDSADRAVERFESGATRAADAVAGAKPDIARRLASLDDGILSARTRMGEMKTGVHDALSNARAGMDRIDTTLDQATEYTAAIDEGRGEDWKGTLGRLVNKPDLADTIEQTTEDIEGATWNMNRFRSWLGLRGEVDMYAVAPRVYLTAEIRARHDKFYLFELEKGMLGSLPKDELTDAANSPDWTRTQQIRDRIRYTAQFGKTLGGFFQIRGGIKDSTFGIGADILLNQGKLRISTDLFGSFTPTPRLKVSAAMAVFRSVYLLGGVDDALNKPGYLKIITGNTNVPKQFERLRFGRDYFLGAALHFDDLDLTTLIRAYGALLVSAL